MKKKKFRKHTILAKVWVILLYTKINCGAVIFGSMFIDQAKVLIINYYILAKLLLFKSYDVF